MEFIKEEDLQLITSCANQDVNETDFVKLKLVYEKLEHICVLLQEKGFNYQIRKDPRRQAGQGVFKFQEYQWAKIYPSEYKQFAQDKFAYIIAFTDNILLFHLMGVKDYQELPASKEASRTCWTELNIQDSSYEAIVESFVEFDKKYRKLFIKTGAELGIEQFKNIIAAMNNREIKELLEYKKQIILQGPPGTGKTRKAKAIAKDLLLPSIINEGDIKSCLKIGQEIKSITDYTTYTVSNISATNITLNLKTGTTQSPTFQKIIEAYQSKKWKGGTTGGDAYEAAIAKYIYENIIPDEQYKLIQFHPAYSYEDFVRGIVAKPNESGEGVLYEAENKTLAKFASNAFDNYRKSKIVSDDELSKEHWIDISWNSFVAVIENEIESNGSFKLTKKVNIVEVQEDCFRYTGEDWQLISRINFKDCKKIINDYLNKNRNNLEFDLSISKHANYRKPYYGTTIKKFISENSYQKSEVKKEELKQFVLIIDEINRANLSSVLGELIYALEYRGEAVESMYTVDGDNKLILPPNLYIIGTMNSADRSIGNIDYAIRRRFAFVDVLPTHEPIKDFAKPTFEKVSKLFIKNYDTIDWSNPKPIASDFLAPEFRPEDIWIGHSYFITKDKDEKGNPINEEDLLKQKLKYEVIPILKEYVKDGVLVGDKVKDEIEKLAV